MKEVSALREKSGAGILDCRNALIECKNNIPEAMVYLQKKGLAAAQKRQGRVTKIGRIFAACNERSAVICELLCETDFVARNHTFIELGNTIANTLLDASHTEKQEQIVSPLIEHGVSVIKENIQLSRRQVIAIAPHQRISYYIHGDEGALGALIVAQVDNLDMINKQALDTLLHDIALHVSAFNPRYLGEDAVPEEYRAQQIKIFTEQARDSGKPDNVVEKIVLGKLKKHLSEICLLEQGFIKEEKKSVRSILDNKKSEWKQEVSIVQFVCYKAGAEHA